MLINQYYQATTVYSPIGGGGFTPTSTESTNFLTRATGITSDTDKTNYDTLITGLVNDGDYSTLDFLYIFAAPTQATAVLDLTPHNYDATEIGTVIFTAYEGYTGNGLDFWLDSGFKPSTATSPNFIANSASIGAYVINSTTNGGYLMGASNVSGAQLNPPFGGTGGFIWEIDGGAQTSPSTSGPHLWIATRTGSGSTALYRDGNTTPWDSNTTPGSYDGFVPRANVGIFDLNSGSGSASAPGNSKMSAAFTGGGLSSTAMARIATRLNVFMTAYSINVF